MGPALPAMLAGAAAAGVFAGWAVRGKSSPFFGRMVWRGDRRRRAVAVTFDDGPSEATPLVLEILRRHGARATFFQIGANARRLACIARAVAAEGHEIGNHTETHAPLWLRGRPFLREEIGRAQRSIEEAAGVRPRLFRPPYGVRWPGLGAVLAEFGLKGVMWTAIGRDWAASAPEVAWRLRRAVGNGAILCLHDGRERAARLETASTLGALEEVLAALRSAGYECLTVSELAGVRQAGG